MIEKKLLRKIINICSNNNFTKLLFDYLNFDTVFLNYHRVVSDQEYLSGNRPNNDLIVSKSVFEEQIKYLKQNFNVISINDINKNLDQKKKIIITFDDGYLDNFENALPVLEKYECPAIIYIVTSFLDNKNYPWWLKIWNIIQQKQFIFYNQKKLDISNDRLKFKIYNFFCKKIVLMNKSEQISFFKEVMKNYDNFSNNQSKEFLSKNDLIKLGDSRLIEIGCHTHNHQNLKILNEFELKDEIEKSKLFLEQILKREISHFSIPFGTKKTFSDKSLELIKKFNFKTIVTTEHGNFDKKKMFRIPRIGIGNNDLGGNLYSKAFGFDSFVNKILNR
tara:strand:- start:2789 stop:3790 length:1002 start_codon:yes stop_codon:yes gene_type:complete